MISRELAALLQCTESALRLFSLPAPAAGTRMRWTSWTLPQMRPCCRRLWAGQSAWPAMPGLRAPQTAVNGAARGCAAFAGFASDTQAQLHVVTSPQLDLLQSDTPWAVRPSMARLLSQPELARAAALATVLDAGEVHERKLAASLRHAGVDDLNAAQVFARESRWHEQALDQGRDPVQWRLQHLPEGPVRDLAQQVAERAQASQQAPSYQGADGRLLGRGFATAQLQTLDAQGADLHAWSAWVAEVAVHPQTGEIEVTRVVAGHDSRTLQRRRPPEPGPRSSSRTRNCWPMRAGCWARPPLLMTGLVLPLQPASLAPIWRSMRPAMSQSSARAVWRWTVWLPAAAAIANAIHHATGVRLREVPFQPEQLRLALVGEGAGKPSIAGSGRGRGWGWLAAGAAGLPAWPPWPGR